MKSRDIKISVVGLGYVGLPLAVEFGKQYPTIGFDIDDDRIQQLKLGEDKTLEVSKEELTSSEILQFTSDPGELTACNVYVVTVPTPVDEEKQPDLGKLENACRTVGEFLSDGDIVIIESTVYPGASEEFCVPILEAVSGLVFNQDFYLGYSPERVNPGDQTHRITDIKKLTAGSTPDTAAFVDELYTSIISAGTYPVSSIRVAEAAKVIENTQRDINIALVNELARLFDRLDLDTQEVLEAAGTKWNFLDFRPGLVGGHCIGVDPYYLTYKATNSGYQPEIILAGRRMNDSMADFVVDKLTRAMDERGKSLEGAKILVMGVTFKENCPDTRNSQVLKILEHLGQRGAQVSAIDPWVDHDANGEFGLIDHAEEGHYDAIIVAVAHRQFINMGAEQLRKLGNEQSILFDVKGIFDVTDVDLRL